MSGQVVAAVRALPADTPDEQVLRAALGMFLAFLADEPAFARVFYIDMVTAGPLAMERFEAAKGRFAELNRAWHERARTRHQEWPAVPGEAYLALAGATTALVRSMVRAGRTDTLPGLEETIVSLHLAVLAGRPWTAKNLLDCRSGTTCSTSRFRHEWATTAPGGLAESLWHSLNEDSPIWIICRAKLELV